MSDKLKDNEIQAKARFDNWDDVLKFLETDCWDTYQDLVDTKWKWLTPKQKRKLKNKQTFADNKNAAVATLAMFYVGAIDFVETKLKEFKEKQKELVAFNKNNV